jgi:hypothetical protein
MIHFNHNLLHIPCAPHHFRYCKSLKWLTKQSSIYLVPCDRNFFRTLQKHERAPHKLKFLFESFVRNEVEQSDSLNDSISRHWFVSIIRNKVFITLLINTSLMLITTLFLLWATLFKWMNNEEVMFVLAISYSKEPANVDIIWHWKIPLNVSCEISSVRCWFNIGDVWMRTMNYVNSEKN